MEPEQDYGRPTRMIFLGEGRLADGFRLIGFETYTDPDPETADRTLRDLLRGREKAFVVVDDAVMQQDIPSLKRVRREGGRIVVIAVPPLGECPRLGSDVARRLTALFGNAVVDAKAEK